MKQLLLILLLTLTTLFAQDARLEKYPQALEWEKTANTQSFAAYNLGYIYHFNIKDSDKAIFWYKKAYELDNQNTDAANNLGGLYANTKNYDEAIKWYKIAIKNSNSKDSLYNLAFLYDESLHDTEKAIFYYKKAIEAGDKSAPISLALLYKKAYKMGEIKSAYGLGYLYDENKNDSKNAIIWYKKAAKQGYPKAINNLAYIYRNKKDNVTATAYILATIEYGFGEKKDTLGYLKNDWKIDKDTLEKAYKLQQTLDIPKHYTGGID